jgi:hypothetical protein
LNLCCVCSAPAEREYHNTKNKYAFCQNDCSAQYENFKQWLPLK